MEPTLAIVQLTAFLLRHLSSIDHHLVVFYYNNRTIDEVDHIAQALSGQEQQLHINVDHRRARKFQPIHETAVVLNFAKVNSMTHPFETALGSRWLAIHLTIDWRQFNRYRVNMPDKLDVLAHQVPLTFIVPTTSNLDKKAKRVDERHLVGSFAWLAFRNRVDKLPAGEYLTGLDSIAVDTAGVADNEVLPMGRGNAPLQFVSGFRIGIFKILAQQLTEEPLNYGTVVTFLSTQSHFGQELQSFRYRDQRLSLRFASNETSWKNWVNLVGALPGRAVPLMFPRRYQLLVPRIVVHTDNSSSRLAHQVLLQLLAVVALWLAVAAFVALRYCCHRATTDQQLDVRRFDVVHAFFDTLCRSLGISPGRCTGCSTSERQLLTVIAVFAMLSGSIFSGFLYDQLVIDEEVQYLYNSLQDVCQAGINISIPYGLTKAYYARPFPNCSIMPYTPSTQRTTEAVVVDEVFLSINDYKAPNFMVLKESYAILPAYINSEHPYLDEPFSRILHQCVEHGQWHALWASSTHLLALGSMRAEKTPPLDSRQTHFEYWWLAIGLTCACVVFAWEMVRN